MGWRVPITDFKMVAGKWDGLVSGLSAKRDDGDWAEMPFRRTARTTSAYTGRSAFLCGRGTFTLSDGKLPDAGDRGSATYALFRGAASGS